MAEALQAAITGLQDNTDFIDELNVSKEEYKALIGSINRVYASKQRRILLGNPHEAETKVRLDFLTPKVNDLLIKRLQAKLELIENVIKEVKHRVKDSVFAIRQLLGKMEEDFAAAKYGGDFGAASDKDMFALERALMERKLAYQKLMQAQNIYLRKGKDKRLP